MYTGMECGCSDGLSGFSFRKSWPTSSTVNRPIRISPTPIGRRVGFGSFRRLSGFDEDYDGLGKFKFKKITKSVTKAVVKVAKSAPKIAVATAVGAASGFATGGFAGAVKGAAVAGGNQALKASRTSKQISTKSTIKGALISGAITGAVSRAATYLPKLAAQKGAIWTATKTAASTTGKGIMSFGKAGGLIGKAVDLGKSLLLKKATPQDAADAADSSSADATDGRSLVDRAKDLYEKGSDYASQISPLIPSGGDSSGASADAGSGAAPSPTPEIPEQPQEQETPLPEQEAEGEEPKKASPWAVLLPVAGAALLL